MSYEILYDRFLVDKQGFPVPYILHGSNNCYFYDNKTRVRNVTNLYKIFDNIEADNLKEFLGKVYDKLKGDSFKYMPKTKKGFIRGFYRKVVDVDDFTEDGYLMMSVLKYPKYKSNKHRRSYREIKLDSHKKLKSKPFVKFKENDAEKLKGKTILAYKDKDGVPFARGRIKSVGLNNELGFVRNGYNRYYIPLYNIN